MLFLTGTFRKRKFKKILLRNMQLLHLICKKSCGKMPVSVKVLH